MLPASILLFITFCQDHTGIDGEDLGSSAKSANLAAASACYGTCSAVGDFMAVHAAYGACRSAAERT